MLLSSPRLGCVLARHTAPYLQGWNKLLPLIQFWHLTWHQKQRFCSYSDTKTQLRLKSDLPLLCSYKCPADFTDITLFYRDESRNKGVPGLGLHVAHWGGNIPNPRPELTDHLSKMSGFSFNRSDQFNSKSIIFNKFTRLGYISTYTCISCIYVNGGMGCG